MYIHNEAIFLNKINPYHSFKTMFKSQIHNPVQIITNESGDDKSIVTHAKSNWNYDRIQITTDEK